MAAKDIATEDVTLTITTVGVSGSISITSIANKCANVDGRKVHFKEIVFDVSGLIQGACGTATPGDNTGVKILTTSNTFFDDNGDGVMRKDDKVTGVVSNNAMQPGMPPTPCTITYDVEITDAGQNEVKSE